MNLTSHKINLTYLFFTRDKLVAYQGEKGKRGSIVALVVKNPPANAGDVRAVGSVPGLGRSPGGGHRQLTPAFLPGESHGHRSLEGYGL